MLTCFCLEQKEFHTLVMHKKAFHSMLNKKIIFHGFLVHCDSELTV
jgi:hypothetical protein